MVVTVCEVSPRRPCTGGAGRWPIYDQRGRRVHTGDTIRAQVCIGRYGQVAQCRGVVTMAHWQYGQTEIVDAASGVRRTVHVDFDLATETYRGYHQHRDFEHGHERWIEVVEPAL